MPRDDRGSVSQEELDLANAEIVNAPSVPENTTPITRFNGYKGFASTPEEKDIPGILNHEMALAQAALASAPGPDSRRREQENINAIIEEAARQKVTLAAGGTYRTSTSSSTSSSSSEVVRTPLDEARDAAASYMKFLPALRDALIGGNATAQEQAKIAQVSIMKGAEAAGKAASAQAELIIGQESVHAELMNVLGLDVRDPQSAIRMLLQKEAGARTQREAIHSQVTELQGVDFFQNPLAYFQAQSQLKQLVPEHNRQVAIENNSASEITRLNAINSAVRASTPAKNADILRAKAAAESTQLLEAAKVQAADISSRAAAGNAKLLMDQFTLGRNVFQDILSLESREEGLIDRRERASERRDAAQIKAEAAAQESALLVGINTTRRMLNGPQAKDFTQADIKAMPKEQKAMWTSIITRGSFGNTYATSIPFIEEIGNINAAAQSGNAGMMTAVVNIKTRAEAMVPDVQNAYKAKNYMAPPLKYDDALSIAYAQIYKTDKDYTAKGMDKSGLSQSKSALAIDYDSAVQEAIKNRAELVAKGGAPSNVLADVLIDAKTRDPYKDLNGTISDRFILEAISAKVAAGTVSPAVAAQQVANFYKNATIEKYSSSGMNYLGMPQMVDYNITPGTKGNLKVDLFNATKIENYLTARVAEVKRANTFGVMGNMFGGVYR